MTDVASPRVDRTPWVWLLAVVPLVQLAAIEPAFIGFLEAFSAPAGERVSSAAGSLIVIGFVLDFVVTLVVMGLSGLWAWLDWRSLRNRGLIRPFPWGWGFVYLVYVIGRTVVVRRRTGTGALPLIVMAACYLVAMIVPTVELLVAFSRVLPTFTS